MSKKSQTNINQLPTEVQLHILHYLDIPDQASLLHVSKHFRTLAQSRPLQRLRLRRVASELQPFPRPSASALHTRNILLSPHRLAPVADPTRTQWLRSIPLAQSRERLERLLRLRPSCDELRNRGILQSRTGRLVRGLERRRVEECVELALKGRSRKVGRVWRLIVWFGWEGCPPAPPPPGVDNGTKCEKEGWTSVVPSGRVESMRRLFIA